MQYKYPVQYHNESTGPKRGKTVTASQADAAMRYVMDKFRTYGKWSSDDKPLGWDGTEYPGDAPTLIWGYDGDNPAIVWEGGSPFEWAYSIEDPYPSEYGGYIDPPSRKWPAGVHHEPYYSFVLVLYRES